MEKYDVVIIGGGIAGFTAAIYTSRSRLRTIILEKSVLGGQLNMVTDMENYPGFESISGPDLTAILEKQAKKFGTEVKSEDVLKVATVGEDRIVRTTQNEYSCGAVIVCSGASPRLINVPGEERLLGKGVSYCATCDGAFFGGKTVAAVGGGNTACEESLFLTQFAKKVTLIHRRNELRAEKILQERLFANKKIEVIWDSAVEEIQGQNRVENLRLKNLKTGATSDFKADGVFVFIGHVPVTGFLDDSVKRDSEGYLVVDENMATSAAGIFAAGDVVSKSVRQAVTSAGDACIAAVKAEKFIMLRKGSSYGENVFK